MRRTALELLGRQRGDRLFERGRVAWRLLRTDETWEKWVAIGRAIGFRGPRLDLARPARGDRRGAASKSTTAKPRRSKGATAAASDGPGLSLE